MWLLSCSRERRSVAQTATERLFPEPVAVGRLSLAAHDGCVMLWLLFATVATVQDAWQLDPHVLCELRTGICAMCMLVAAVTSAVDR